MANKSKRGTKRKCLGCEAKFYDLDKDPIICPMCGETFVIEVPEEDVPEPVKEVAVKPVKKDGDSKLGEEEDDDLIDIDDDDDDIDVSDDDDTFLESDEEPEETVKTIVAPALKGNSEE